MKNLIYQYYDGPILSGTEASVKCMKEYAERIGADTIVMVTHSRGLMATLFHMSTTRKIALYNNIPLFAFKAD